MKNYNKHREASVDSYPGKAEFVGRIRSGEFKIAVYGLGHVGSPLARGLAASWRACDRRRQVTGSS